MPKITITEKDLTSGGVYLANENVVYIPGLSTKTLKKEFVGVPTLCKSVEQFKEVFGDTPVHVPESSEEEGFIDKSFVITGRASAKLHSVLQRSKMWSISPRSFSFSGWFKNQYSFK